MEKVERAVLAAWRRTGMEGREKKVEEKEEEEDEEEEVDDAASAVVMSEAPRAEMPSPEDLRERGRDLIESLGLFQDGEDEELREFMEHIDEHANGGDDDDDDAEGSDGDIPDEAVPVEFEESESDSENESESESEEKSEREGGHEVDDGDDEAGVVSKERFWEWLFFAPPPHGCLTFLDCPHHVHRHIHQDERGFDDDRLLWKPCACDACLEKQLIFDAVAPTLSKLAVVKRGRTLSVATLELILMRLRCLREAILAAKEQGLRMSAPKPPPEDAEELRWMTWYNALQRQPSSLFLMQDADAAVCTLLQSTHSVIIRECLHMSDFSNSFCFKPGASLDAVKELMVKHPDMELRRDTIKSLDLGNFQGSEIFSLVTLLIDTATSEVDSDLRAAAYRTLANSRVLPSETLLMPKVLDAIADSEGKLAAQATRLLVTCIIQWDLQQEPENKWAPRMTQLLLQNIISHATSVKSLLLLSLDCLITHTDWVELRLYLPAELQELVRSHATVEYGGSKSHKKLRRQTKALLSVICSKNELYQQMLPIVHQYLEPGWPWHLRLSALKMLVVLMQYVKEAWNEHKKEYIEQCLVDSEVHIRTIAYKLIKQIIMQEEQPQAEVNRWFLVLVARFEAEEHPLARAALLSILSKCIAIGYLKEALTPTMARNLLEHALKGFVPNLFASLETGKLGKGIIVFIRRWFFQVNTGLLQDISAEMTQAFLPCIMDIFEHFLTIRTSPRSPYLTVIDAIKHVVLLVHEPHSSDSPFKPYLRRAWELMKNELDWLHYRMTYINRLAPTRKLKRISIEEQQFYYVSLGSCMKVLSHIMPGSNDLFSTSSCTDLITKAVSFAKILLLARSSEAEYASTALLYLLQDLLTYNHKKLTTALNSPSGSVWTLSCLIFDVDRKFTTAALLPCFSASGSMALYTPKLVLRPFLDALLRRYDELLLDDVETASTLLSAVLKVSYHFVKSVPKGLAVKLLTDKLSIKWTYPCIQESAKKIIGWARLVQHHFSSPYLADALALNASFNLLDVISIAHPQFLQPPYQLFPTPTSGGGEQMRETKEAQGSEEEEEDDQELEHKVKEAICWMLESFLTDEFVTRVHPQSEDTASKFALMLRIKTGFREYLNQRQNV